jgi:NADH:ubiquinone oxidoreductase subunit 3 (subunit A)
MTFYNGIGMFLFIFVLLLGFIYEIINGALEWE